MCIYCLKTLVPSFLIRAKLVAQMTPVETYHNFLICTGFEEEKTLVEDRWPISS